MVAKDTRPCWFNEDLPPPVATSYTAKGRWDEVEDLQIYVTGTGTTDKAVVLVYDAFGPSSQILQGADRLADHLDGLVIMPDFFKGKAPSPEDRTAWMEFRKTLGDVDTNVDVLLNVTPALKSRFPTVKSWGCFGLCWGGKVTVLAAIAGNNPFKATGQTHPGRLEAVDAQSLTTQHICMPSKDEPEDEIQGYEKILAEKKLGRVERFSTMFHGWMGARANLEDAENVQEYQRGYQVAAKFFAERL